jgi:hypothetical protein
MRLCKDCVHRDWFDYCRLTLVYEVCPAGEIIIPGGTYCNMQSGYG